MYQGGRWGSWEQESAISREMGSQEENVFCVEEGQGSPPATGRDMEFSSKSLRSGVERMRGGQGFLLW